MTKRKQPESEGLRDALEELADQIQVEAAVQAEVDRLTLVLELAEELGIDPQALTSYLVGGQVEPAVLADPRLTEHAKTIVRSVYRAFLQPEGLELA